MTTLKTAKKATKKPAVELSTTKTTKPIDEQPERFHDGETPEPKAPPTIRYAKDHCLTCAPKAKDKNPEGKTVKWAATYADVACQEPIWKCCGCGRTVTRKERTR